MSSRAAADHSALIAVLHAYIQNELELLQSQRERLLELCRTLALWAPPPEEPSDVPPLVSDSDTD